MNTGAFDFSKIGHVEQWNYQTRTDYFAGSCGMINGSAGEFYPPNQTKDKPVSFYSSDMCRSIDFDFEKEVQVHGITGYKYSGGKKTVDNGTAYPENKCFSEGQVVPSGVMNVTSCRYGTPVFMSFPHYYAADPYYLDMVDGLSPSQDKHEFSITLEPKTGIPLDVAARFQINMLVRPMENIGLYHEAPTLFFPVLWFEQTVSMGEEMANEIRAVAFTIPVTGYICGGLTIVLGVVMVLWVPVARLCGCGGGSAQESKVDTKKSNLATQQLPEGDPLIATKNGHYNGASASKAKTTEGA